MQSDTHASDAVLRCADVPVVCSHPDDESVGLGTLVHAFINRGARLPLERYRQLTAIGCHGSQLLDNPNTHRYLELSGDTEALRLLHDPALPFHPTPR